MLIGVNSVCRVEVVVDTTFYQNVIEYDNIISRGCYFILYYIYACLPPVNAKETNKNEKTKIRKLKENITFLCTRNFACSQNERCRVSLCQKLHSAGSILINGIDRGLMLVQLAPSGFRIG